VNWNSFLISDISPVFTVLQINHLIIECHDIFIGTLIEILRLLPNLDSLKVYSLALVKRRCLSVPEVETFRLVSKNNKITKVNLERINELAEIEFLIDLCPSMEYFEVYCSDEIDLKLFVRFILMKTNRCIPNLCTLCLSITEENDTMVKTLQEMINLEALLDDYTITRIYDKIYIQLK
jgi:hypothetical protein